MLLHLHQCLGRLNMGKFQELDRLGSFGCLPSSISNCELLLCKACLHSKQHKSSITSSHAPGVIDALYLTPGAGVSGDQVESTAPGMVPTYRGSPNTKKYHAFTLFVDHASRFLHFNPHLSTSSH